MTIGDRVVEIIHKKGMSQKEFSEATGIAQGTISDWKTKRTNPSADKILIICKVLGVDPTEILSATESERKKNHTRNLSVVDMQTEEGMLIELYHGMDEADRSRLMAYANKLKDAGVSFPV